LHGVPALDGAIPPAQQVIKRHRLDLDQGPMKDGGNVRDAVVDG
jgi:hypothetical protein